MRGMSDVDKRSPGHAALGIGLPQAPVSVGAGGRLGRRMFGEALAFVAGTLCGVAAAVLGFWAEH